MLNLEEILAATDGEIINKKGREVRGFSIDTRTISEGDVFVPLPGSRTDGHKFIEEAYEKGAVASLAESKEYLEDTFSNFVLVNDTEKALLDMAHYYRSFFRIPIIGVTGSWGKTTSKELIASILSTSGSVHKSPGNYNTEYGLPLALLEMQEGVDYAVFELGLQYPGDVKKLSEILEPTLGLITGVGKVHLGNFSGTREIAREKLDITAGMDRDAKFILGGDCPVLLDEADKQVDLEPIFFGTRSEVNLNYRGEEIQIKDTRGIEVTVTSDVHPDGLTFPFSLESKLNSRGNAINLLGSSAVGLELGLGPENLKNGANIEPLDQRLQPVQSIFGTIINDTYNANPKATRNALDYLKRIEPSGDKVFVFGDMMELGEEVDELHRSLAGAVRSAGVDLVYTVGKYTRALIEQLNRTKQVGKTVEAKWFESKSKLTSHLEEVLNGDDNLLLVKGSREMEMEKIVSFLKQGKRNKIGG